MTDLFDFGDLDSFSNGETYVICPTTGKKLNPNTLLPIENHVSFDNISLEGENTTLCERCGSKGAFKARQNTSYIDEESNYVTLCEPCHIENKEYWDDMWKDYYSGLI